MPDGEPMRAVARNPAAETAYRRYLESLESFAEAYEAMTHELAAAPGKGWRTAGDRRQYVLAKRRMPRVRVTYIFDEDAVIITDLEAF